MHFYLLTTIGFVLFSNEINGHQPRIFLILNAFILGILSDVVHRHGDCIPRGIFHKSKIKKPKIIYKLIKIYA